MIKASITSSLEKIFADESLEKYGRLERISALRGERVSVQLIHTYDRTQSPALYAPVRVPLVIRGALADRAAVRGVFSVPVAKAVHTKGIDDNYLRSAPGMYPDLLAPLYYGGCVSVGMDVLSSAWVEIEIPEDMPAGEYETVILLDGGEYGTAECRFTVEVIAATPPSEDIYFTQWFHADCLADYYNVDVWSERHWQIVESFVKTARRGGINTLLTPVFTPPLDTAVGGERRTTQLVGVSRNHGEYTFDFTLLDRWIDMCDRCGIEYLEIAHFFTQWGAAHAPKIMASVDGEYKRIFGWDTDAIGEEYKAFLRLFITELLSHLRARGDDKRCFFHVSDEPGLAHLENYRAARAIVSDLLDGYTVMDALSSIDFYKEGAVEHPIPSSDHIAPFIEAEVGGLWTYYCVSQALDVSNRYMSMPLWRTRSIGMQIYKYNIEGFLHWGYNFYNNQFSGDPINPYVDTCADLTFPGGDSFSVYPASDGTALESIRFIVFYEALQDIKAMKLCESFYGHDRVVAEIESVFGRELRFDTCARSAECMLAIRERINRLIKEAISK